MLFGVIIRRQLSRDGSNSRQEHIFTQSLQAQDRLFGRDFILVPELLFQLRSGSFDFLDCLLCCRILFNLAAIDEKLSNESSNKKEGQSH